MKKKIGELNRTRIVTGDKRELLPGEVHVDDVFKNTNNGSSESPSNNYTKYYFVDWDKADPNLINLIRPITEKTSDSDILISLENLDTVMFNVASTVKTLANNRLLVHSIVHSLMTDANTHYIIGFSCPVYAFSISGTGEVTIPADLNTFVEMYNSMSTKKINSLEGIEEVSAEKYYSLDPADLPDYVKEKLESE